MAENESGQERSEDASPRKKLQARKKGTVAKSVDLTSSLSLLIGVLMAPSAISAIGQGWVNGMNAGWSNVPSELTPALIIRHVELSAMPSLAPAATLIGVLMAVGLATSVAQVGFVLSPEALVPSFAKLNPLQGFKRLFSGSIFFDFGKALGKSLVFGALAWSAIAGSWAELMGAGRIGAFAALQNTADIARGLALKVAFLWLAIASIDYFVQRKRIDKQLKMSKQELKQEMRENEQSPELRMEIARKRRKLSKMRMLDAVANADVVITNPTHFAVALQYDSEKHSSPVVVAKGADFLAAKIRELAQKAEVPLVPNPPLARALFRQCEVGDTIPKDLFQPVAEVLAYVYKVIRKVRSQSA